MKRTFFAWCCFFFFLMISCNSTNQRDPASAVDTPKTISPLDKIPQYRTLVKTEPVAEYKQKLANSLNNWFFSVKVYETQKTLNYLIKMQYEEVTGDDTLKLPNLGVPLTPVIQPGKDKYSCVIGFMDPQNKFEDCKIVNIEDGNIKLTAIKHYYGAVYRK